MKLCHTCLTSRSPSSFQDGTSTCKFCHADQVRRRKPSTFDPEALTAAYEQLAAEATGETQTRYKRLADGLRACLVVKPSKTIILKRRDQPTI